MKRVRRVPISSLPEYKVLSQVAPIKNLIPRIDRFQTIEEGLAESREMHNEITVLGRYTQKPGFTRSGAMQRVARIPSSVWSAVLECFPTAGEDKELYYALLAGPLKDYDLRGKPSLT